MRARRLFFSALAFLCVVAGCTCFGAGDEHNPAENDDAAKQAHLDVREAAAHFAERATAVWSGPATQTPLGDFPIMTMDLRPLDDAALFSRADLDAQNALRFLFEIETTAGTPQLIFRNGGLFAARVRDTRTVLVEHDAPASFRFCALDDRGCDYIDARFDFDEGNDLVMDVHVAVLGGLLSPHVHWEATRVEAREVLEGFPSAPPKAHDAPFPDLASLDVTITFNPPPAESATLAFALTTQPCSGVDCVFVRTFLVDVAAGTTQLSFTLDQVHAGSYHAFAFLDTNGNAPTNPLPDGTDLVGIGAIPFTVGATGTASTALVLSPR